MERAELLCDVIPCMIDICIFRGLLVEEVPVEAETHTLFRAMAGHLSDGLIVNPSVLEALH